MGKRSARTNTNMAAAAQAALEAHPLADIFPLLQGEAFAEFAEDIGAHGLREPIVLHEGKILEGRNRYRACIETGVEPRFETYTGDDPLAFVVSLNVKRRHLNESQRAVVAARMATLPKGSNQHAQICAPSQEQAADLLHVSRRYVQHARVVLDRGCAPLQAAVERGEVAIYEAARVAAEPVEAQREFLESDRDYMVWSTDRRRRLRAAELADTTNALPIGKARWPLLLADPPWRFEEGIGTTNRRVENHYPTMTIEDILALPVADLATDDAILFLWTTSAHLMLAGKVIEAWGFTYKSGLVWTKPSIGTGYWVRCQHEHLLIAIRGNPPQPQWADVPSSVIQAPRREHSRKPDESYELIERAYSTLPKLELFARRARPGWQVWGNEAQETS